MSVHCDKCGYQNDLQHSFCGMCGAKLPVAPRPAEAAAPPAPATAPSSTQTSRQQGGGSILGLAEEPSQQDRLSYLLEDDEEPPAHRGKYVVIAILVAALGLAGWNWRGEIRNLMAGVSQNSAASQSTENTANPAAPSAAPAVNTTEVPPPATTKTDQAPSTPAATNTPPPSPEQSAPAPAAAPAEAPAATGAQAGQGGNSGQTPALTAEKPAETAPPAQPGASQETPTTPPQSEMPAKAPPPAKGVDALEESGERYLYGRDVPMNCGLAQKNLLAAAQGSNAKAQSVLGTMYATGHCVSRDLPTAYQWFSKALRQDPSNTRYEQDLKVLWRQMTDAERQHALRSSQ